MQSVLPSSILVLVAIVTACPALGEPQDKARLPGRPVKVAAIAIGCGGEHEAKIKLAREHLEAAGTAGVDIACLPEEFAGFKAEPIPGPTTTAIGAVAKKHRMYVVCPIREQAGQEQFNTAVLIDRAGKVAGRYRKVFVFWREGLVPSREGVKVFDTDFGRIAILTCFDINFPELWQQADLLGAEIVFWPSAYGGGIPLCAYAMLHHYYVVPVGAGNLIDITGKTLDAPPTEKGTGPIRRNGPQGASHKLDQSLFPVHKLDQSLFPVQRPLPGQFVATLDLDRTLIHTNFNEKKVERLLKEHSGEVEMEKSFGMEAWYLVRAVKPGVRVRDLCEQYQIESLRDYCRRSRQQIDEARKTGKRI